MYYRVNGNVVENYKFNAPRARDTTPAPSGGGDSDDTWIYVAAIGGGVLVLALIVYFYMANKSGYKAIANGPAKSSKKSKVGFKFF